MLASTPAPPAMITLPHPGATALIPSIRTTLFSPIIPTCSTQTKPGSVLPALCLMLATLPIVEWYMAALGTHGLTRSGLSFLAMDPPLAALALAHPCRSSADQHAQLHGRRILKTWPLVERGRLSRVGLGQRSGRDVCRRRSWRVVDLRINTEVTFSIERLNAEVSPIRWSRWVLGLWDFRLRTDEEKELWKQALANLLRAEYEEETYQQRTADMFLANQNLGNSLGTRSAVRQTKFFRMHESGNTMKALLGSPNLAWDTTKKQGAYQGHKIEDPYAVPVRQSTGGVGREDQGRHRPSKQSGAKSGPKLSKAKLESSPPLLARKDEESLPGRRLDRSRLDRLKRDMQNGDDDNVWQTSSAAYGNF
eukprot:symbB.v1.2.035528.t1/scaffold4806.1/size34549/2